MISKDDCLINIIQCSINDGYEGGSTERTIVWNVNLACIKSIIKNMIKL